MSRTYTAASSRDADTSTTAAARFRYGHGLLALTSIIALAIVGLAYVGRFAAFDESRDLSRPARTVDLNALSTTAELEPALSVVFANPEDRRLAAQGLFDFVVARRTDGQVLPNVGILARATAATETLEKGRGVEYRERLQQARAEAKAAGKPSPTVLPLLTASNLADLKASIVVRSPDSYRRLILFWGALYFLSFWAIPLLWLFRGVSGD